MAGVHDKHRQRLKERYLKQGFDSLELHVVIELLLGYSIPRKDTNEIAHDLMNKFGSISGILSADIKELQETKYITEHSAILLKLIWDMFGHCSKPQQDNRKIYNSIDEIGEFVKSCYVDCNVEIVYAFSFDHKSRLKSHKIVHKGSFNSASFRMKTITEFALSTNAAFIVLAHNHPNNTPYPSSEDLISTKNIWASLNSNSIELREHFIVYDNGVARIMDNLILY